MLTPKFTTSGDRELIERFDTMPAAAMALLKARVAFLAINLAGYVKINKLAGQVLKRKSGALSNSIKFEVKATPTSVTGSVFSSGDVKYAAIQEYGGKTRAHDIYPTKGQALAFMMGGKQVFAGVVHHPGSTIPERSYLRSSLAENAAQISSELKAAQIEGVRQALQGRAA